VALSFSWALSVATLPVTTSSTTTAAQAAGANAYRDLAVDTDGDIYIDPDTGDLVGVSGIDAVASDLRARLETFLGEYQWDTEIGVPYLQEILGEKPARGRVEEIFRGQILETPGISEVVELTVSGAGRELSINFNALCDLGAMIAATLVITQQTEA